LSSSTCSDSHSQKSITFENLTLLFSTPLLLRISATGTTENDTPPKPTKSRNSNSSVPVQIKPKSKSEFVPRDIEKSEFLNVVNFGDDVAFSVETIILFLLLRSSTVLLFRIFAVLQPIADKAAQNLEIISKYLSTYQNSAQGIDDEYKVIWY